MYEIEDAEKLYATITQEWVELKVLHDVAKQFSHDPKIYKEEGRLLLEYPYTPESLTAIIGRAGDVFSHYVGIQQDLMLALDEALMIGLTNKENELRENDPNNHVRKLVSYVLGVLRIGWSKFSIELERKEVFSSDELGKVIIFSVNTKILKLEYQGNYIDLLMEALKESFLYGIRVVSDKRGTQFIQKYSAKEEMNNDESL